MRFPLRLFATGRSARRRRRGRVRVEPIERRLLPASTLLLVDTTADDGPGSLRWAIAQANQTAESEAETPTIRFAIPGDALPTIQILSPLDAITRPVFVEARSAEGTPTVHLDGSKAGANVDGLIIEGGDSVVAGLIVTGFSGAGIVLRGAGGDYVESCYVGLLPDADGRSPIAAPNGVGILVSASSHQTIGGLDGGRGNVIAANRGAGVLIVSAIPGDSTADAVLGNWIGTDPHGTSDIGNGGDGVVFSGATRGRIEGNVVSGNRETGIVLNAGASGDRILGNLVGLSPDGLSRLGNRRDGIRIEDAPDNEIGGPDPESGNQISANGLSGIRVKGDSQGLTIRGNWIGVDPTGTVQFGNQVDGVSLASSRVTVGGPTQADGNTIAFNGQGTIGAGVQLIGTVRWNSILSNRIYDNAGLGINLGNGPTPSRIPPKSPPAQAVGPNDWTNAPTLASALGDGEQATASGQLTAIPGQTYVIQFFWSSSIDPSGFGEAERYLGQTTATTNASGAASFWMSVATDLAGGFLSATATDENGNTSEFSASIAVHLYTDLHVAITADPPIGPTDAPVTFTATVTNRGRLSASGTVLIVTLPVGSSILSYSGGPGATTFDATPSVRLTIGSLAAGASAVLTVLASPLSGSMGAFEAVAAATMNLTDGRPGDETDRAAAVLTPPVDIALKLASGPASAHPGDTLTYVLIASNAGPSTASGVVLNLPIPAGSTFTALRTAVGGATLGDGRLRVPLGDLAPGATARIEIDLLADAVGLLSTVATLSSDHYDLDPTDQAVPLHTDVAGRVSLSLDMEAPTAALAGVEFTYNLILRNNGPDAVLGVDVRDVLPSGAAFVRASIDGGVVSFLDGVVTARIDLLAAGAEALLRIVVRPTAAVGTVLRNVATASSLHESNPSTDSDARETTVREASDLGVAVVPVAAEVVQGRHASYRILVRNDGPATEPDAVLAVALPADAPLISAVGDRGGPVSVADGLIVFRLGSLEPGAIVEATIVLEPSAAGPLNLVAVVGGLNVDDDGSNQRASAVVTVLPTADLATYVDPPTAAYERTPFQYTLTAANLSTATATGVLLSAPIPTGLEFVSAQASQGDAPVLVDGRLLVPFGTLAGSASATVTITVRPAAPSGAVLLLSGAATSDLADPNPGNDHGGFAVSISPAVDLLLRLRPAKTNVERGDDLLWIAEVWNSSTTTATGLTIVIPHGTLGDYIGASTTQGTATSLDGVFSASVGTLAPGAYATIAFVVRPRTLGAVTLTATAEADQHVNLTSSTIPTAVVTVLDLPGTIAFESTAATVAENIGVAYLDVVRTGGSRGAVSVSYRTLGGTAAPGVDYQPTSGVLTFQDRQTSARIAIPILPFSHNRGDVTVSLVLESPVAAPLGSATTAVLTIQDLDPDLTPPTVSQTRLLGPVNAVGGLTLTFSEPIDPTTAWNSDAYALYDLGPKGVYGDGDDVRIPLQTPGYDAATRTLYLTPTSFLPLNRHFAVMVRGTGPDALIDLAGNPLGGGVDFVGLFARGSSLKYEDATGDSVSLALRKGGFLDLIRAASGDAVSLTLQGIVPGRSTLIGRVVRSRLPGGRTIGDGVTPLGAIEGLGAFGDVRVGLRTPPFLASGFPSPPARTVTRN